jgi:dTDP-glucose 4,6-dehydratase
MNVLVTGGCGFIGSHFITRAISSPKIESIENLDALTYSGNLNNLSQIMDDERHNFTHGSINDYDLLLELILSKDIGIVVNFAAESHVDRSINSVEPFVKTNIDGTRIILEAVLDARNKGQDTRLLQVSTDEVYGSLSKNDPSFTESTPLDPKNPYSATKAASDLLVRAFSNTHEIPAVITRCSNNYGPFQFPEKLIPLMTLNALGGKKLPIYGDGMQIRDWIHVSDHVDALMEVAFALESGQIENGEVFNIGADNEIRNIEIVNQIIDLTGASLSQIQFVSDRPGHDRRYAMGFEKMQARFDWAPRIKWETGIRETIEWYKQSTEWVDSVIDGSYRDWISKQYR